MVTSIDSRARLKVPAGAGKITWPTGLVGVGWKRMDEARQVAPVGQGGSSPGRVRLDSPEPAGSPTGVSPRELAGGGGEAKKLWGQLTWARASARAPWPLKTLVRSSCESGLRLEVVGVPIAAPLALSSVTVHWLARWAGVTSATVGARVAFAERPCRDSPLPAAAALLEVITGSSTPICPTLPLPARRAA